MKIYNDTALYEVIAEIQRDAAINVISEKRLEMAASIYNYIRSAYAPRMRILLRSYRQSNIAPYNFDDKDSFLDFIHQVFTDKFIIGDALVSFDLTQKNFEWYLVKTFQNELKTIIDKNKRGLPDVPVSIENQALKDQMIAHNYALLFDGKMEDRRMLYCAQGLLARPSDMLNRLIPDDTAAFLLWRELEQKVT